MVLVVMVPELFFFPLNNDGLLSRQVVEGNVLTMNCFPKALTALLSCWSRRV